MNPVKKNGILAKLEYLINEHNMIPDGCIVLVACSGGADSICLLHALLSLREKHNFSVAVAHFNHQLRGEESARDEAFVREFAGIHSVPIFVDTAPVAEIAQNRGQGIEETARILRYDFFEKIAEKLDGAKIATAHTADDNGETILMHLVRGSGLRGLSGIPPVRENIIRPLLSTSREEIESYLTNYNITHVEDSSNQDKKYLRNRIRHDVMPILRDINPNFLPRLEQTTSLLREENDYLDTLVRDSLSPIQIDDTSAFSVPIDSLLSLPRTLALRGIQYLSACCAPDITLELSHRQGVLQLCHSLSPSASLNLPKGLVAYRQYDKLIISQNETSRKADGLTLSLPFDGEFGAYHITISNDTYSNEHTQTPFDFWVDNALLQNTIDIRQRKTGDYIKRKNRPNASLKKLFIDEKIPLRVRDELPIFVVDDQIFAVPYLGVAEPFLPSHHASAWHILITCY